MSDQVSFPQSTKENYNSEDVIDFVLSFQNMKIKRNSIRLQGDIELLKSGNTNDIPLTADIRKDNIQYDGYCGLHGVFSNVTTSTESGVLDNMVQYGYYVKTKTMINVNKSELGARSDYLSEGRIPSDKLTKYLLFNNPASQNVMSFSLKPDCALNNSNMDISYTKTGQCKISLRVASANQFLYGSTTGYYFRLKNLKLRYKALPDDGKDEGDLLFNVVNIVHNTISNNNANLSSNVAGVCQSVSIVFRQQDKSNIYASNHYELDYPNNITDVEFSWNDELNRYISYRLRTEQEILRNFVESMGNPDKDMNAIRPTELNHGKNYGVGLKFGAPTDLSNQKFNFNLVSDISDKPYNCFMIFRGVVKQ